MKGNNILKWSLVFVLIFVYQIAQSHPYGYPIEYLQVEENFDEIKKNIENGVNVNKYIKNGKNALMLAAEAGEKEIVEYLLKKGADINSKSFKNETPLFLAAYSNQIEIVYYLIIKGANYNKDYTTSYGSNYLIAFSSCGLLYLVQEMVGKGADINKNTNDNNSALNYAIRNNRFEVVKYLVSKGADISNKTGVSPLYFASIYNRCEILEFLLENGANRNIVNIYQDTIYLMYVKLPTSFNNDSLENILSSYCLTKNNILNFDIYDGGIYYYIDVLNIYLTFAEHNKIKFNTTELMLA